MTIEEIEEIELKLRHGTYIPSLLPIITLKLIEDNKRLRLELNKVCAVANEALR